LVDLDGDGRIDILSGSWPGEIYFFRRQTDGTFAAGEVLKGRDGKPLTVGHGTSAFAADWHGRGAMDLIVGNVLGEVYLIPNEGRGKELAFGTPRRLEAAGQPIKVNGDAAPVVADWDGDSKPDLLVGAEDGSAVWFRNIGTAGEPKLEAARKLIGTSPVGWDGDDRRKPGQWGLRVKLCVVDWDGDGRLDILLGDRCGSFRAKPTQTEVEKTEERKANDVLPVLRKEWAAAYQAYRALDEGPIDETPQARREREQRRDGLRETMVRLKDEIAAVQEIQERYQPGYQAHGFVWLFQRKPLAQKGP
jgi:hypothetical protein